MNVVKLQIGKNIYEGYNHYHPEFMKKIVEILYSGNPFNVDGLTGQILSSDFSINSSYALGTGTFLNLSTLTGITNNFIGIYCFSEYNGGLVNYKDLNNFNGILPYPISMLNLKNQHTYNVSLIDNYSFVVSQNINYSVTGNEISPISINSFSLRSNMYKIEGSNRYTYFPIVYINMEDFNFNRPTIYPSEVLRIDWTISFKSSDSENSSLVIGSSINSDKNINIRANIHDDFKKSLTYMLFSSNYNFGLSGNQVYNLKITNIVAYESPNEAINNSGNNCFIFNRSLSAIKYGDYAINISQRYVNDTGTFKRIGSLLLCGSMNGLKTNVPIAWINSSSLWGQDVRILDPNEVIEIHWTISLDSQQ